LISCLIIEILRKRERGWVLNIKNTFTILLIALVSVGCGADLTCDEPQKYQMAIESSKITSPEGLDPLRSDRELRVGRASPSDPRSADSPCLDTPPRILSQESS